MKVKAKKFVLRTPPEFAETVPEPWMGCVGRITNEGETQLIRGFGTKKEATAWATERRDQQDETVWDEGKIISPEPPRGPDCRE